MNESEKKLREALGVPEDATLKDIERLINTEGWSIRWDEERRDGGQIWHVCNVQKDGTELPASDDPKREIAALITLRHVRVVSKVL